MTRHLLKLYCKVYNLDTVQLIYTLSAYTYKKFSPFTVYIVVQNVQFVHCICTLYKLYSLYRPCVHALKKCSPFTVYIVVQSVQFVHCTAYTVKNGTVYIQYTPCLRTLKNKCSPFTV